MVKQKSIFRMQLKHIKTFKRLHHPYIIKKQYTSFEKEKTDILGVVLFSYTTF